MKKILFVLIVLLLCSNTANTAYAGSDEYQTEEYPILINGIEQPLCADVYKGIVLIPKDEFEQTLTLEERNKAKNYDLQLIDNHGEMQLIVEDLRDYYGYTTFVDEDEKVVRLYEMSLNIIDSTELMEQLKLTKPGLYNAITNINQIGYDYNLTITGHAIITYDNEVFNQNGLREATADINFNGFITKDANSEFTMELDIDAKPLEEYFKAKVRFVEGNFYIYNHKDRNWIQVEPEGMYKIGEEIETDSVGMRWYFVNDTQRFASGDIAKYIVVYNEDQIRNGLNSVYGDKYYKSLMEMTRDSGYIGQMDKVEIGYIIKSDVMTKQYIKIFGHAKMAQGSAAFVLNMEIDYSNHGTIKQVSVPRKIGTIENEEN